MSMEISNLKFVDAIKKSFYCYLNESSGSRSTSKLKPLHGYIASCLQQKLGREYSVQSQGYEGDREGIISGRYYDKKVDITISYEGRALAGYAVKFVMQNYSQNSNNYFENMLGETANLRSNAVPYFQIFIIFDKVPYYDSSRNFKKYDNISQHNLDKYLKLSADNTDVYFHTPDLTLISILHLKEKSFNYQFSKADDYKNYYKSIINDNDVIMFSNEIRDTFGDSAILNNFESFIERSTCLIKGKFKIQCNNLNYLNVAEASKQSIFLENYL